MQGFLKFGFFFTGKLCDNKEVIYLILSLLNITISSINSSL